MAEGEGCDDECGRGATGDAGRVGARCVAVVPAYRSADTLAATLKSLTSDNADCVDRVVVVVSPGDRAAAVALSFTRAGKPVEVIEVPERLGAGAARNLGRTAAADAPFLLFVDADCRLQAGGARRLLADCEARGLDAVAARVLGDGGSLVSWMRHALEFKEAEGRGVSPWPWFAPTASMLCRTAAFDAVGGFEDMWPGEDLVFCWRLQEGGFRLAMSEYAVTRHWHPPGWMAMFRHQYDLGLSSAEARRLTGMPGAIFVRHRWLAPALLAGRVFRALIWFARYRPAELALLVACLPLYSAALLVWTVGFVRGCRDAGGGGRALGRHRRDSCRGCA